MKVFVASTYQDLQDYRAAATRSVLMAGNLSEDMSYWQAIVRRWMCHAAASGRRI